MKNDLGALEKDAIKIKEELYKLLVGCHRSSKLLEKIEQEVINTKEFLESAMEQL